MDRYELTEALLLYAVGLRRAAEIVGDLRGTWRWIGAISTAAGSSFLLLVLLAEFALSTGLSVNPRAQLRSALMTSSLCLSGVTVTNMLRFGTRDRVTLSGVASSGVLIAAFCAVTAGRTALSLGILALCLPLAVCSLRETVQRRSVMILAGAALGYTGAFHLCTNMWSPVAGVARPVILFAGVLCGWLISMYCGAWLLSVLRTFAPLARKD